MTNWLNASECLTTAQLSIIAKIICLFVFQKQHRPGTVKTAFGYEQLCFGGCLSCSKCVTLKHISIHL